MRKVPKQAGIYVFSWGEDSYFYIGQSQDLEKRKKEHLSLLKRNSHHNKKFQNVFNKHGSPKFCIVEECEIDELNEREQFYLDLLFSDLKCVNIAKCAEAPKRGLGVGKIRATITVAPDLLKWWQDNSPMPLSSFVENKMEQFSSSFISERKIEKVVKISNISWIKSEKDK